MKPFDLLAELERIADDLAVGCHQTARMRVDSLTSKVRLEAGEVDVTPCLEHGLALPCLSCLGGAPC